MTKWQHGRVSGILKIHGELHCEAQKSYQSYAFSLEKIKNAYIIVKKILKKHHVSQSLENLKQFL